jgi:hypothetical protein
MRRLNQLVEKGADPDGRIAHLAFRAEPRARVPWGHCQRADRPGRRLTARPQVTEKRAIALILTILFDEVEGIEHRGSSGLPAGQLNHLAVNREALGPDPLGGSRDG